jgi:hypothetical protein
MRVADGVYVHSQPHKDELMNKRDSAIVRSVLVLILIAFCTPGISYATTVGTICNRIDQNLAQTDTTNANLTRAEVRDRAWQASCAVAMLTECIEAETTLVLTANVRDYTPGSSFYGIKATSLRLYNSGTPQYGYLNRVDVQDIGKAKDSLGQPIKYDKIMEYSWFANKVRIFPTLSSFAKDSLIVTGFKLPAQFDSNNQVSQMPVATDWLVEIAATMMCQQADMTVDELMAKLQTLAGFADGLIYTSAKKHRNQQVQSTGNAQ